MTTSTSNNKFKWPILITSAIVAGVVGIGEALVAVYFTGAVTASIILYVACPAFIVNFLLFRSDVSDFLQSLVDNKFFKDKDGNDFTGKTRTLLHITLALAIFAGFSCGFLQLNSILTTIGSLFFGLSATAAITAPSLTLVLIAGTIATLSAIATMALLYFSVEKFAKNKEYQKYSDIYYSLTGQDHLVSDKGEKKLTLGWKIYHGLFALTGLVCAIGIYFISMGMYQSQAFTVFNSFCKLSASTSNILSIVFINLTGQFVNGFFYIRNMLNLVQDSGDFIKDTFLKYKNSAKTVSISNEPASASQNALWVLHKIIMLVIFYCTFKNAAAQGQGAMTEPKSLAWVKMLKLPTYLAEKLCFFLMGSTSLFANFMAAEDEIKPWFETKTMNSQSVAACSMPLEAPTGLASVAQHQHHLADHADYSVPEVVQLPAEAEQQQINAFKPAGS